MIIYEKPWYYSLSHIVIGIFAVYYPILGICAFLYQLIQYIWNIRIFPIERILYSGNSLEYTGLKLAEYMLGICIGYLLYLYIDDGNTLEVIEI